MRAATRTALVLCATLAAGPARANGRFPAASQVVFDPGDPEHFALNVTFGLIESWDGGTTFEWTCELALGLNGTVDPAVVITENGTTVVANNTTGVLRRVDRCSFTGGTELSSLGVPDLSLSRSSPREIFAFRSNIVGGDQFASQVMHTSDEGVTWSALGGPLPETLLPLTIDVAPSQPERVYISARLGSPDGFASVLLRSDDGGESFEQVAMIPGTENLRQAYIAAVHPSDADRIYIRVDDPNGTIVLMSEDGGLGFETLFTGTGPVLGFAVGESELALGGPSDGTWIADVDGANLRQISAVGALCLTYGPDDLYACADWVTDGFSLGRRNAAGDGFEPLLKFEALCGSSCAADTQVGMVCPAQWISLAPLLGSTCNSNPSSSGGSGSGGTGPGAGSSGASSSGAIGGASAGAGSTPSDHDSDGSCASCAIGKFADTNSVLVYCSLAFFTVARRRKLRLHAFVGSCRVAPRKRLQ